MKSETTDALIQEWEQQLANNKTIKIPDVYFSYSDEQNHEEACYLFRYVFENILDWTPYDAMNYMSAEIVDKLGLSKPYSKLMWPADVKNGRSTRTLDSRSAYGYVAALCYPNVIREYNLHNLWIMEYNRELSGEKRASVKDFETEQGYDKARLLFNHWLVNHPEERFTDLEAMYRFFASKEANGYLKKIKLDKASAYFFKTPLEYFHESLPEEGDIRSCKSEFLLQFVDFETKLAELELQELNKNEQNNEQKE